MTETDTIYNSQPFYTWDTADANHEWDGVYTGVPLDSIFKPHDAAEIVVRESLFRPTSLQPQHSSLKERPEPTSPIVFGVILLICILVMIYYKVRGLKIKDLIPACFNRRAMDRMVREGKLTPWRMAPIAILLVGVIGFAVQYLFRENIDITLLPTIIGGAALLYLLRNGLLRLVAVILSDEDAIDAYITSNYCYHLLLSTLCTPLLFLMVYPPLPREYSLYIMGGLVAIFVLTRIIRGMKLFLTISRGFNFFLFYYLCIVETAPILILVKWFFGQ